MIVRACEWACVWAGVGGGGCMRACVGRRWVGGRVGVDLKIPSKLALCAFQDGVLLLMTIRDSYMTLKALSQRP